MGVGVCLFWGDRTIKHRPPFFPDAGWIFLYSESPNLLLLTFGPGVGVDVGFDFGVFKCTCLAVCGGVSTNRPKAKFLYICYTYIYNVCDEAIEPTSFTALRLMKVVPFCAAFPGTLFRFLVACNMLCSPASHIHYSYLHIRLLHA